MARPQEHDAFEGKISFRCWQKTKDELEKLAEDKNIELTDYVRGVLTKHISETKK